MRMNKIGGIGLFQDLFTEKAKNIKECYRRLVPDLTGTAWKYESKGIGQGGLPKYNATDGPPKYGPTEVGRKIFDNIEDYLINQIGEDALNYVVKCSNFYAAEEPVIVRKTKKNRYVFEPCELGRENQRWRCGDATAKAAWKPITKWHVLLVFAIQLRAGAKRLSSPLTMWVGYDDCADHVVKANVSQKQYISILRYLSFALPKDSATLGRDGKPFKTRKVKPWLDKLQKRARELYDPSQELGADEMCVLCKSMFCSIKQRNTTKPKRIHIKVYGLGDCNGGYLLAWKVYEGAGSGTLKEIIVDDLFPVQYSHQKKVVTLDNYFSSHNVSHGMMQQHGAHTITTCSLSKRKVENANDIDETDFPFIQQSNSVAKGLRRGFLLSAKTNVNVDSNTSYTKWAKLWNDTKLLGCVASNPFNHKCI